MTFSEYYINDNGKKVLGFAKTIAIGNFSYAIISEIESDEIFLTINFLYLISIIAFIILFIIIALIAFLIISKISKRINKNILFADNISEGNLSASLDTDNKNDELSLLSHSLLKLANIQKI